MASKRVPVTNNGITYWRCSKCKKQKPADEFCKNKSNPNGLADYCKPCHNKHVKEWQRKNKEKVNAYDATYRQTAPGKQARNKAKAKSNAKYPKKARAREMVYLAKSRGDLIPEPCETCGVTIGVHAHHDDYSKPLEVRWFCGTHHREHHKNGVAI